MMLKRTRPMMHGSAVKRLQEQLDHLGFDYGANDGIFGRDTEMAVKAFQSEFGLTVDGIVGPATIGKIHHYLTGSFSLVDVEDRSIFYDRCGRHKHPKYYARTRNWSEINGVTLHQTGCPMPTSPSGWDRLNAHFGITQEGLLIQVNPCTDMIWHAQGLSRTTIGIEIEGNYPGLIDNCKTLWKGGGPACSLNAAMLEAAEQLFAILTAEFATNNVEWEYTRAHRQSKNTRTADPGEEIWKLIAMPWMIRNGSTDGGSDFKRGSGKPIPKQWNSERTAAYR